MCVALAEVIKRLIRGSAPIKGECVAVHAGRNHFHTSDLLNLRCVLKGGVGVSKVQPLLSWMQRKRGARRRHAHEKQLRSSPALLQAKTE